jgi:hypothetical protein
MTFVTNEKDIQRVITGFKGKIIVINEPRTAKVLKKLNREFQVVKGSWSF